MTALESISPKMKDLGDDLRKFIAFNDLTMHFKVQANQPAKSSSFHPLAHTLDPLPLVIVSMLFYRY